MMIQQVMVLPDVHFENPRLPLSLEIINLPILYRHPELRHVKIFFTMIRDLDYASNFNVTMLEHQDFSFDCNCTQSCYTLVRDFEFQRFIETFATELEWLYSYYGGLAPSGEQFVYFSCMCGMECVMGPGLAIRYTKWLSDPGADSQGDRTESEEE
jgi:hypothetical protein